MSKSYTARSLPAAQRRVRELTKLQQQTSALLERYAKERRLLAMLAADTPQFDNPLLVYEAKKIRDGIIGGKP